jgi:hypothetical protein
MERGRELGKESKAKSVREGEWRRKERWKKGREIERRSKSKG